ncbi:MAG: fibronectin type III domain-containing protein, partial [Pseudomonadota bacterium]
MSSYSISASIEPAAALYRFQVGGVDVQVTTSNVLTRTGLDPEVTESVRVRAENAAGESAWSAETDVTTEPLTAPTVGPVTATNSTTLSIPVVVPAGAASYRLYRDGTDDDALIESDTLASPYSDGGLSPLSSHLYWAETVHPNGTRSALSESAIG